MAIIMLVARSLLGATRFTIILLSAVSPDAGPAISPPGPAPCARASPARAGTAATATTAATAASVATATGAASLCRRGAGTGPRFCTGIERGKKWLVYKRLDGLAIAAGARPMPPLSPARLLPPPEAASTRRGSDPPPTFAASGGGGCEEI